MIVLLRGCSNDFTDLIFLEWIWMISKLALEQKQEQERVYLHLSWPPLTIRMLCRESETAKNGAFH